MQTPVRFGPFRFSPATGELERNGRHVPLQAQPARVLAMLIAHSGEVLSRDAVRLEIWSDTWVNLDQGLNYCIRQIRVALEDDARSPKYVQTLAQRGYRFVASVAPDHASLSAARRPQHLRAWLVVAAILLGIASGLQAARLLARELLPAPEGRAFAAHLAPLDFVQGAWSHHLKPLLQTR